MQIDIAGRMLSLRYPMEVDLVGDSAETLRALLPAARARSRTRGARGSRRRSRDWWRTAAQRALQPAEPLNPQRVFHELSPRLPDGCILAGDSGSSTVWYARHLKLRRGMQASLSGTLATMGSAIPYALAAKFAYPDRPVVALVGDGAMQMSGINALIDVARAWRRWADPRLLVLVLNNRDLSYVTWEQRVMEGEPRFPAARTSPTSPTPATPSCSACAGVRVDRPDEVAAAWDEALAADRPVVLEAVVDPDVPTVPPALKPEQLEKLRRALAAGDPEAEGVLRQARAEGLLES